MLHDRLGDPVDLGISADRLVEGINEDHLEVLVGGILTNPVGAQHPETLKPASDTFLQNKYKKSVLPRDTNFLSTTMLTFRLLRKVMQSCMQFIGDNVSTNCSIVVHLKHEGLLRRWTGGS
jgi:hypothetical protein